MFSFPTPMSSKTVHHILIDSRDRDESLYPHPNGYRVRLPKKYRNVVSARLLAMSLPTSFYVFTAAQGNTELLVSVNGSMKRLLVPDGNYTPQNMALSLQTLLLDEFPDNTFEVGIDPVTLKLIIRCLEGAAVAVQVPDPSSAGADRSLASLLGFRGGEDGSSGTLISSALVNTNPWLYIVLDIDELSTIDEGGVGGDVVGKGCFAHISLPASAFSYIFREDMTTPAVPQSPPISSLQTLTVTFRTHDGRPLDFQGIDHAFVLELVTQPPRPPPASPVSLASPPPAPQPPQPKVHVAQVPPPAAPPGVKHWRVAAVVVALAAAGWWWYRRRRSLG